MLATTCYNIEEVGEETETSFEAVAMRQRRWTLFTNHAAVFFHLLEHPDATIRRVADELDLAERTVVGVLGDLREEGYLLVRKEGRHNVYRANVDGPMKRPEHAGYTMREFFTHIQGELNRANSAVKKQVSRERPRGPSRK